MEIEDKRFDQKVDLFIEKVRKLGYHSKNRFEKVDDQQYRSLEGEQSSFKFKGDFVIVSRDLYDGLSNKSKEIVIKIQQELLLNNPLWELKETKSGSVKTALAELKRKGIILGIHGSSIYIVNPAKIRRGSALGGLMALFNLAHERCLKRSKWKPASRDIKVLEAPLQRAMPGQGRRLAESTE